MKIEFRQSGGVAGVIRPPKVIDTDALPEAEANRWHDLVAAADFFRLPGDCTSKSNPRRDAFTCVVKVDHGAQSHVVHAQQGDGPPALDRLIESLRQAGPR